MTDPWHFPRPAVAREFLAVFDAGAANTLSLFAPRRSGKTEFLRNDLAALAEKGGYRVVYVSFWKLPLAPAAALLHELHGALSRRALLERVADFWSTPVSKLKFSGDLAGGKGAIELDLTDDSAQGAKELFSVLDRLFARLTRRQRLLLLLDEVQELALPANDVFFKFLRTQLDTNKERLFAVLTGSSMTGLARLFGPRTVPFYRFGIEKSLPPFDHAFVDHMLNAFYRATHRKLERSAALKVFDSMQRQPAFREVVAALTAHPQWDLADAHADYRRRVAADSGYVRTWNELSEFDRAVLRLVAAGERSPYGRSALKRLGTAVSAREATTVQVQSSLRRLTSKRLVMRDDEAKTYLVEDEQFSTWVRSLETG